MPFLCILGEKDKVRAMEAASKVLVIRWQVGICIGQLLRFLSTHVQKSSVMIFVLFTGHWVKEFHLPLSQERIDFICSNWIACAMSTGTLLALEKHDLIMVYLHMSKQKPKLALCGSTHLEFPLEGLSKT